MSRIAQGRTEPPHVSCHNGNGNVAGLVTAASVALSGSYGLMQADCLRRAKLVTRESTRTGTTENKL
jgi:hypothetical protein